MSGWGGVVLAGLAGAASGVGGAITQDALEQEKIKAQRERDAYLAQLQVNTHKQIADVDIANVGPKAKALSDAAYANREQNAAVVEADSAAKKRGDITAEGGVRVRSGESIIDPVTHQPIVTGPKAEMDPDIKEATIQELQARTRHYDASSAAERERASAYAASKAGSGEDKKPLYPKFELDKDSGQYVDQLGIIRVIEPGQPAVPEEKNLIFPNKPAKAATAPVVRYFKNGVELDDNDMQRIYPALGKKTNAEAISPKPTEGPAKADSTEVPGRSASGTIKPSITSAKVPIFRGKDPATGKWLIKYSDGSIAPE